MIIKYISTKASRDARVNSYLRARLRREANSIYLIRIR